jgi:tight adherence protein B
MNIDLTVIKYASLFVLLAACLLLAFWSAHSAKLPGSGAFDRYVQHLDSRLRRLFQNPNGKLIAVVQLSGLLVTATALLISRDLFALAVAPFVVLGPHLYLKRLESQKLRKIESKVDAFTVALGNALRATPNVSRALATVATTMPAPLSQELELTLRDLRVGSTLDQALTDFSARVGSTTLDSTISALLIGRRVGGNVPEILAQTGASVREMTRLQAVLRAKTADGRVQAMVLAVFPIGVVLVFDMLSPGYFAPLTTTPLGSMIMAVAGIFWVAALVLSRKIMKVEL